MAKVGKGKTPSHRQCPEGYKAGPDGKCYKIKKQGNEALGGFKQSKGNYNAGK
jgi:hypothetical protein